ncbi:hypothetical protein BGX34_000847, partial [Mortierella sp. NVP85]
SSRPSTISISTSAPASASALAPGPSTSSALSPTGAPSGKRIKLNRSGDTKMNLK